MFFQLTDLAAGLILELFRRHATRAQNATHEVVLQFIKSK